jgi:hypothetical protein
LTNDQTKDQRNSSTNEAGRFSFASVKPGVYTLKIEHQGFEKLLRTKIFLSANESLALGDMALKTGQLTETVTITSEGQVVEKESSDLTARLTSDQINLISTKGRDVTSLLRLLPGTSNIPDIEAVGNGFGTTLPTFSGQRSRSTVATVDGLNASEPSGSNLLSMTTSLDAISEVKVLRDNYAAEYGNNGGAMINIVTKGGGSEYRGTAYYFIRNADLLGFDQTEISLIAATALFHHKAFPRMKHSEFAELDKRARARGRVVETLVEVNVGGEASKSGVAPDGLGALLEAVAALPGVKVRGLMAIPPEGKEPDDSRVWFRALRKLGEQHGLTELSMGMSSDFEVAIEEGATVVRVGTAIFGPRPPRGGV